MARMFLFGGKLRRGEPIVAQMLEAWDAAITAACAAKDLARHQQLVAVAEERAGEALERIRAHEQGGVS